MTWWQQCDTSLPHLAGFRSPATEMHKKAATPHDVGSPQVMLRERRLGRPPLQKAVLTQARHQSRIKTRLAPTLACPYGICKQGNPQNLALNWYVPRFCAAAISVCWPLRPKLPANAHRGHIHCGNRHNEPGFSYNSPDDSLQRARMCAQE
jgi:hypothetical protein